LDDAWIEEYGHRQLDLAKKRILQNADYFNKEGISLPRLVDWEFKPPYSNVIPLVPILSQTSFFEQQILVVDPYKTEQDFKNGYGLSISGVIDLWKKKKLLVGLGPPEIYTGLDYLDPILEREPPCLSLLVTAHVKTVAAAQAGIEYYEACVETAFQKLNSLHRSVFDDICRVELASIPTSAEQVAYMVAQDYAILCAYGFNDLADKLLSKADMSAAFGLKKYAEYLVLMPRYYALDGIVSLTSSDFEIASQLGLKPAAELFPVDVGKMIARELPISFIRDLGDADVVDLQGQTASLRRLLLEIDQCARKGEYAKLPREEAIEKVFEEAENAARSIAESKKLYRILGGVTLGVLGPALGAALTGLPGLIAGAALGITSALPSVGILAERLAKWGQKSHAVAYFDLKKELGKKPA
jgi:hypothetical protein